MVETLKEAKRVLRHNGVMIIATTLPALLHEANWFAQLIPNLADRYSKRFPTMQQNIKMLEDSGFRCAIKLNLLGNEVFRDYYDAEGPLKAEWRNTVSMFAMTTDEEIGDMERLVREMIQNGTIQQYIEKGDRSLEMGFVTLLGCVAV